MQYRTRFGATFLDPSANSRFVSEGRNSERNEATLDIGVNVRKTFVVGKTTAAAFLEVFNLLNSDDLRIFSYDPNRAGLNPRDSIPAGENPGQTSGLANPFQIDAERRFGRRFQLGIQFQF